MSQIAQLRCRCGRVHGQVEDAARATVNRVVCYCDDCQAFLHELKRADLLDEHGGSDIVQVAPATLSFSQGTEHIACMRLSPKGLYRFYSTCCNTPLGNTVGTSIPFVGIIAQSFVDADGCFDKAIGGIMGKFAVGTPPAGSDKLNVRLLLRAIGKVLSWRLGGKAFPHPFFARGESTPKYPVHVLSKNERDELRPYCGPRGAAHAS